ncbi:MAG: exosortase A [Casimicrobiaceae bacterium]
MLAALGSHSADVASGKGREAKDAKLQAAGELRSPRAAVVPEVAPRELAAITDARSDVVAKRAALSWTPSIAVGIAALAILALYWRTADSIVAIWIRSETFAHGFVVIPICLWLVWRKRATLARLQASPWWPGLIGVFLAGILWLVASAAGALGIKQFALAFMIQAAIVTVVGTLVARALVFPLVFLLFAVPAGEIFVPTLIDWTADFTVAALRASGVPVYREANFFMIPTGAWSVVDACSGVRYLIASVMVGTIYAAVAYRSPLRRVVFIAVSIVVPIVANWLRAYMIVMLAHSTNNTLAVGVDHIIYGWVFFGLVMVLLFWVASFWQEAEGPLPVSVQQSPRFALVDGAEAKPQWLFAAAIAAIAIAALWPPIEAAVARPAHTGVLALGAVPGTDGWQSSQPAITLWKPHNPGFVSELNESFIKDGRSVGLYVAFFRNQEKGRELVTSGNVLVTSEDPIWRLVSNGSDAIDWAGARVAAQRANIVGPGTRLDVFRLYWVNGTVTSNDYVAKARLAWSKLRGQGDDSAIIIVYSPQSPQGGDTATTIRNFVAAMSPSIERNLEAASGGSK